MIAIKTFKWTKQISDYLLIYIFIYIIYMHMYSNISNADNVFGFKVEKSSNQNIWFLYINLKKKSAQKIAPLKWVHSPLCQ